MALGFPFRRPQAKSNSVPSHKTYRHGCFESSGCTEEFPSTCIFTLPNFLNLDGRCRWAYSFIIAVIWWMTVPVPVREEMFVWSPGCVYAILMYKRKAFCLCPNVTPLLTAQWRCYKCSCDSKIFSIWRQIFFLMQHCNSAQICKGCSTVLHTITLPCKLLHLPAHCYTAHHTIKQHYTLLHSTAHYYTSLHTVPKHCQITVYKGPPTLACSGLFKRLQILVIFQSKLYIPKTNLNLKFQNFSSIMLMWPRVFKDYNEI